MPQPPSAASDASVPAQVSPAASGNFRVRAPVVATPAAAGRAIGLQHSGLIRQSCVIARAASGSRPGASAISGSGPSSARNARQVGAVELLAEADFELESGDKPLAFLAGGVFPGGWDQPLAFTLTVALPPRFFP